MNPNPYIRPNLPGEAPEPRGRALLASWVAVLDELARLPAPSAGEAFRRVALAGKVARTDPATRSLDDHRLIALATSACDATGWQDRLARHVDHGTGDVVTLLDELDDMELVSAAATRVGLPTPLPNPDACVGRLVDELGGVPEVTDHARAIGITLRPDLPETDPVLARTAEKFVALLDVAEAELLDEVPLPPLRLPSAGPAPTPPPKPGRIPALRGEFAFKAGTPPTELPPVPPYQWRGPGGERAMLAVPRMPPPDRTLALVISPVDCQRGKPVLLGGLRGVVNENGVAKFNWDDVVAIGAKIEDLFVGSGAVWECLTRGDA